MKRHREKESSNVTAFLGVGMALGMLRNKNSKLSYWATDYPELRKKQIIPNEKNNRLSQTKNRSSKVEKSTQKQIIPNAEKHEQLIILNDDKQIIRSPKQQKQITPYEEKDKDLQNSLFFCFHF